MSELFGACARGVDGSFWCFGPTTPEPALDGVLGYSMGGAFLSGFLNSEPSTFDCEILRDHQVACEGSDIDSQLGFAAASTCQYNCTPILSPQQESCPYPCVNAPRVVPGVAPSIAIMGIGGPCALQTDGSVVCWGAGANGGEAPLTMALPDKAVAIAGGQGSCAVLAGGELACWALGDEGPIDKSTCPSNGCTPPVVVPQLDNLAGLSGTYDHSCAVRGDGATFCWGENLAGELGDGTTNDSTTPARVATSLALSQVSTAFGVTCAVTTDAHVACWGLTDGSVGVDGATTCPELSGLGCRLVPVEVPGVGSVKQVAAIGGGPIAYALLTDGTVLSIDDGEKSFVVQQVAP
jgi:hypothetical protein